MAIIAMASACQVIDQPMTETGSEKATVLFTASIGADTKTVLDYDAEKNVYKNLWADGDGIWVGALQSDGTYQVETCIIADGVGTTNATFAGTLEADRYIAYQGYGSYGSWGITPYFQHYQGIAYRYNPETGADEMIESYGSAQYPMYAVSNDNHFAFKNLAAILKVGIIGSGTVNNVVFTTNDPSIAVSGPADIEMDVDGLPAVKMLNDSSATNSVIYQLFDAPLDAQKPLNCYIVLPPQVYKGGFTITINSTTGSMTKTVTGDVEFKRSEIRSMGPIEYKEETVMQWGLIGSMTEWADDVPMTLTEDGTYVLNNYELKADDEFKFRANGDWNTNFGGEVGAFVKPGKRIKLYDHGANMMIVEPGVYNIELNPSEAWAYFELVAEPDMPIECVTYDEIADLPDGSLVKTYGYVFAEYKDGFIMNVGDLHNNCILVENVPGYTPVPGNKIEVIAYKTTMNNLAYLYYTQPCVVLDDREYDYGYGEFYNLSNPKHFESNIIGNRYYYVIFVGTLSRTTDGWEVTVDGVDSRFGKILSPSQDLSPYKGKKVKVEGWFTGYTKDMTYMTFVLKNIEEVEEGGGSTEDVIPGDDIFVTKSRSKLTVE